LHKGYQSQTLGVLIHGNSALARGNRSNLPARGGRLLTVLDRTNREVTPDLSGRVTLIVRGIMDKRGIACVVGLDDDLRGAGLSSLDIVNLMLAVESELDIKIPERDMTPSNFRSIARIVALVRGLAG
jgi:acyl carrier protein